LTASATVQAIGIKSGMTSSGIASAVFTKNSSTIPYQINCGGNAVAPFAADAFHSGDDSTYSSATAVSTSGVANAAPAAVYQTERFSDFTYTFPGLTSGTAYTVRLHFAEIWFTAAGSRLFNVIINGQPVLTNFDVFTAAGGADKAVVKEFQVTANGSGQIIIQFVSVLTNAKCSGIEILKNTTSLNDHPWDNAIVSGMGSYPNPLTKTALVKIARQNGWKIYDLSGNLLAINHIQENGIYFVGTEIQTARKIVVLKQE
jgi:hypothetical protein